MTFLQTAPAFNPGIILIGLILAIIYMLIPLGIYLYFSFAYRAIAKKTNHSHPNIGWIPIIGPCLITSRTAKMHWWPVLLNIIPFFSTMVIFMIAKNSFTYNLRLIVGLLVLIPFTIFLIFFLIWNYKTFRFLNKPGWQSLIGLIIVYLGVLFLYSTAFFVKDLGVEDIVLLGPLLINVITFPIGFILQAIYTGRVAWSKN